VSELVPLTELTEPERAVVAAFGGGTRLDLAGRPDRKVRAAVLVALLTGGSRHRRWPL
jgi:hypothetical protein